MSSSEQRLLDLLAEFERRQAAGQPITAGQLADGDQALSVRLQAAINQRQSEGGAAATRATFGSPTDPMATVPGGQTASAASPAADQKDQAADAAMRRKSPLGPYELLEMLGKGGMGAVFKARHTRLNKFVAIKVLPENLMQNTQAVARFDREMKAVGALEHPNIVRAMDANEHQGTHYLVMEYVDGEDLQRFVRKSGTLSVPEACRLIHDAAKALDYAHRYGLVHRDIKPSNLLITKTGQLKVLDLGLARLASDVDADDGLTNTGASLGTPDYMAPEQWNDSHTVDHRTDLYALGCTLYYLLVGRAPYGTEQYRTVIGKMTAHAQGIVPSLREARPDVPAELDALYQHLLAKQVDHRLATAAELVKRIEPFCLAPLPSIEASGAQHAPHSAATIALGAMPLVPAAVPSLNIPAPTAVQPSAASASSPAAARRPAANRWLFPGLSVAAVAAMAAIVAAIAFNRGEKPVASSTQTNTEQSPPPAKTQQPTSPAAVVPVSDPPATQPGWHGWPTDAPPPAIAPFDAAQAKAHQEAWAKYLGVPVEYTNSIGMKFRLIPPGEFEMGVDATTVEQLKVGGESAWMAAYESCSPQHRVTITKPYYLASHELTNREYGAVINDDASPRPVDDLPARSVSFAAMASYLATLQSKERLQGVGAYFTPTSAQWELACRAGSQTRYFFGDDPQDLPRYAWVDANSEANPHSVGQLLPNPFGLFDVYGNVWEWCSDRWSEDYYRGLETSGAIDPTGPTSGNAQVFRGGDYGDRANHCESGVFLAMGDLRDGMIGLRLALSVEAIQSTLRNSGTKTPESPEPLNLTTADGWLNLLPLVDVQRDGFAQFGKNEWRVEGNDLIYASQPGDEWGIMQLPAEIDSSQFEVKLQVVPLRGANTLRIDLPVDGKVFAICFFELPGSESVQVPTQLEIGKSTTVLLRWTRSQQHAKLTVEVAGQPKFEWEGEWEVAAQSDYLKAHTPQPRLIFHADSAYRVESFQVKALKGTIQLDDRRADAPNLPPWVQITPLRGLLPDPHRNAAQPRWQVLRRMPPVGYECAWSSDGKSIAVVGYEGMVHIIDAETFAAIKVLNGGRIVTNELQWQPNGTKLVGTEWKMGNAWLWDTATGVKTHLYRGDPIEAAWSFTGKRFVTGGNDGDETVRCWSEDGQLLWATRIGFTHCLAWSRDDQQVFFSGTSGLFSLSADDGAAKQIEGPALAAQNRACKVATHPHDDVIAIGRQLESDEIYIELWNYRTMEVAGTVASADRAHIPESLAFSPDGKHLVCTERMEARAEVFDATSLDKVLEVGTGSSAHSASWAPDSARVVFATAPERAVRILSLDRATPVKLVGVLGPREVQVAPDQRSFARHVDIDGGMTSIFQPIANKPVRVPGYFWGLSWTPDGKHALSWNHGAAGLLVDPASGDIVTRFKECSGQESATGWSSDGDLLTAAGYHTPLINVWKRDGSKLRSIDTQGLKVLSLAISPDKKWLSTGFREEGKDGAVWNLETGERLEGSFTVDGDTYCGMLYWLNESDLLVSGYRSSALWKVADGKLERVRDVLGGRHIVRRDAPTNPWLLTSITATNIVLRSLDGADTLQLQAPGVSDEMLNVIDDGAELSLHCNDQIIRTWDSKTGELKRLLVLLANDQAITYDPTGKVLWQTADAEKELVYVVEQPSGSLKMHTPEEFRAWAAK